MSHPLAGAAYATTPDFSESSSAYHRHLQQVESFFNLVSDVTTMLERKNETMLGPMPHPLEKAEVQVTPQGLISQLDTALSNLREAIKRLEVAVDVTTSL